MRVVSLLPAATEIVALLGRSDTLVAVSHECDWPPAIRDLPRATRCDIHGNALPSAEIDRWVRGALAFRLRYAPLFASGAFGADISERLIHGDHCIEVERWWRVDPATGERREGEVIVHYTVIDGKIGMVRFYR